MIALPRPPRIFLCALLTAHAVSVLACTITVFVTPFLVRALGGDALEVGLAGAVLPFRSSSAPRWADF